MTQLARRHFTLAEYLSLEQASNVKHEYREGEIYAIGGGTPMHAAIAMNVGTALSIQLRGKRCRVHTSDARVRVAATGLITYPDLSVVCGRVELDPEDQLALANPIVLVEVLSPSTADYDRSEKIEHYKQIPSLHEIVLVAHDEQRIDVWRLHDDAWTQHTATGGGVAALTSIDCELVVDEIYRDPLGED